MTTDVDLEQMARVVEAFAQALDVASPRQYCPTCGRENWDSFADKQRIDALLGAATRLRRAASLSQGKDGAQ